MSTNRKPTNDAGITASFHDKNALPPPQQTRAPGKSPTIDLKWLVIVVLFVLVIIATVWAMYQWFERMDRGNQLADVRREHRQLQGEVKVAVADYQQKLKEADEREMKLRRKFFDHMDEVNRKTDQRITAMLQKVKGVLVVKDGQAQEMKNKQAAVELKGSDYVLTKGESYPVHFYSVQKNGVGNGLAGDEDRGLFLLRWEPGKTKPPPTISGYIHAQGVNIYLGKSK